MVKSILAVEELNRMLNENGYYKEKPEKRKITPRTVEELKKTAQSYNHIRIQKNPEIWFGYTNHWWYLFDTAPFGLTAYFKFEKENGNYKFN
jgi:hypothetical protein|tara:strand:- start:270 stop:545 length:276 start_codon:yes stop_codon:yes gene_type:complete